MTLVSMFLCGDLLSHATQIDQFVLLRVTWLQVMYVRKPILLPVNLPKIRLARESAFQINDSYLAFDMAIY